MPAIYTADTIATFMKALSVQFILYIYILLPLLGYVHYDNLTATLYSVADAIRFDTTVYCFSV